MTTSELMQRIKSAGFYPIPVEGSSDRDVSPDLMFSGSLEDFFEATKALGTTVMFLFISKLDEEDFHYDSDYDSEDEIDESDNPSGDAESSVTIKFQLRGALTNRADRWDRPKLSFYTASR
jgi:hypothetical protein